MRLAKRTRDIHLHAMLSQPEYEQIKARMAEVGSTNMGAFIRKMALTGFVLNVDLSPVRELVLLQRRCSNNLNQVAVNANKTGVVEQQEIAALQQDYAALWKPLAVLLEQLAEIVKM